MSKTKELITNALIYYDKNVDKYSKIFSKFKYFSFNFKHSDIDHNEIIFYDENKKEINRYDYEIIGIQYNPQNLWTWSWSVPDLNKNSVYISRKILSYGLDIPPTKEDQFIKAELITSRFKITNDVQIDIHVAIASYLSKNPIVYKIIQNLDNPEIIKDDIIPIDLIPTKHSKVQYLFLLEKEKEKEKS